MSLKAKLEAVIYAAEEPVTLGQLSALFADEALELKAEQEAAAKQAAATGDAGNEPEGGAFLYVEFEEGAQKANADSGGEDGGAAAVDQHESSAGEDARTTADHEIGATPSQEVGGPEADQTVEARSEAAAADELDAEAEAKRVAKAREREARGVIRQMLDELIAEYAVDGRGIEIREIAGGFRMATKPECHDAVRSFVKSQKPPLKLSLPALETLAVVAYKQPVTVPEVNEIRGVDSSGVFGSLLARKLIATAGRKQVIGRPILYKTTREFLTRFGLKDVTELPSMEEFEKMAASELEEPEAASEEEKAGPAAEEFNADMSMEAEETAGEGDSGAAQETEKPAAEQETAGSSVE